MRPELTYALLASPEGIQYIADYWETIKNKCSSVAVQPATFCKAQTVDEICEHIRAYPKQICNTPEAYLHTLEFTERHCPNGPVGSACEINEIVEMDTLFIWTQFDGLVWIEFKNGEWEIIETMPDKIPQ